MKNIKANGLATRIPNGASNRLPADAMLVPSERNLSHSVVEVPVQPMGILRAMKEAADAGYSPRNARWKNLGQGAPEVDALGNEPRVGLDDDVLRLGVGENAYAPVEGVDELREAIAKRYNDLYRVGKKSKYSKNNVTVTPGGRPALCRAVAALRPLRIGFVNPDYAAFAGILETFSGRKAVELQSTADNGFRIEMAGLRESLSNDVVDAALFSNPCNPTGTCLRGGSLRKLVQVFRQHRLVLVMDEFYSQYVYPRHEKDPADPVSSAVFVDDVERDQVVIVDGLSKSFRYPGWRIGWAVGPTSIIQNMTAVGSFIDGGAAHPLQKAATEVLRIRERTLAVNETRNHFRKKRDLCVDALRQLGVGLPCYPQGSIYAFGSTCDLPAPLNSGQKFFREALRYEVITVPGVYFDLARGVQKSDTSSPLCSYVRFSFGPSFAQLTEALKRIGTMVRDHSR